MEREKERQLLIKEFRWDDRAHTAATLINMGQRKQSYHGPSHTLTKLYSVLEMSREMTK